jgi:hypothetical protein
VIGDEDRDDRDDYRGYGDLEHYFIVLPFYSCPCLSIQATEMISVEVEMEVEMEMDGDFFRYFQPINLNVELACFINPEIFFSFLTSFFLFYVYWIRIRGYTFRWQRNRIIYSLRTYCK